MSKRLQVLLDEQELAEIQDIAARSGLTVSAWVRQLIHGARQRHSTGDPARKLAAVREAMRHSFPTGDIEQMLEETERGYLAEPE
ncbi:MAG: antitoxin [Pseudonocardiales bacterium]|nr:antitoxin [Pseudonocardiales bacterium]